MKEAWDFDAIVVGSGFAGAVTACRLAEARQRVCILERGRRYLKDDFPVLPAGGAGGPGDMPDFTRAFWQLGQGLWDVRDLGRLVVAQAAGYGGGSLIYANVHLRAPTQAFDRWPEAYRAGGLADYYDRAAFMLNVQRMPDLGLPKTAQLERTARDLGRPVFRPPLAVNFDGEGRNRFGVEQGSCDLRGECCFGCGRQAKNTLDLNYLARAEQLGVEVRTLTEAVSILPARRNGEEGYEVACRDHLRRGRRDAGRLSARYVFLCAGAVNTTELLIRSQRAGLRMTGSGLGTRFHPNADALAVAFECDEPQEADRGPTITSSLLYDDGSNWLLVQDGGMPAHLESLLGFFRGPLWLGRNRHARTRDAQRDGVSQRPAYAELPLNWLVDVLAGLARSAMTALPLPSDEVNQRLVAMARARGTRRDAGGGQVAPGDDLRRIASELRARSVYRLGLAAEPMLESLLEKAAEEIAPKLEAVLGLADSRFALPPGVERKEVAQWALMLGMQLLWGSQTGLVGAVADTLQERLLPEPWELLARAAGVLRWGLDYRHADGHTAVLLSMGRDSRPWRLDLDEPRVPGPGTPITGAQSGASAILVSRTEDVLVLTQVSGRFQSGEALLARNRAFAVCASDDAATLGVGASRNGKAWWQAAAEVNLCALRVRPLRRPGGVAGAGRAAPASLRARPEPGHARPVERSAQERLLRAIAGSLGGELRTDPLAPFLDRHVTVHGQGGCPMADDPVDGVTDPDGQVFGCPGLYVMDAAAFPTPVGVNPSATILAVAERKVERFIQQVLGEREWRAEGMDDARKWAAARPWLDPLAHVGPSHARQALPEPIGIRFTEVMKGTLSPPGRSVVPIGTQLTVVVPDLAGFLDDDRAGRRLLLEVESGWVEAAIIGGRRAVSRFPKSYLRFGGGYDRLGAWRALEYHLELDGEGGYVLDGAKDIHDDAGLDVWRDTTTLPFKLSGGGRALGKGVLHLPAADFFATQLPSFEVVGTDDPARKAWALFSFARFFLTHLIEVYLPALDRVADVARAVAERAHV